MEAPSSVSLHDQLEQIRNDRSLSDEERRAAIDALNRQMLADMERVVEESQRRREARQQQSTRSGRRQQQRPREQRTRCSLLCSLVGEVVRFVLFPVIVALVLVGIVLFLFFFAFPLLLFSIVLISAYYCCTQDPVPPRVLFSALWDLDENDENGNGNAGRVYTRDELQASLIVRTCTRVLVVNATERQAMSVEEEEEEWGSNLLSRRPTNEDDDNGDGNPQRQHLSNKDASGKAFLETVLEQQTPGSGQSGSEEQHMILLFSAPVDRVRDDEESSNESSDVSEEPAMRLDPVEGQTWSSAADDVEADEENQTAAVQKQQPTELTGDGDEASTPARVTGDNSTAPDRTDDNCVVADVESQQESPRASLSSADEIMAVGETTPPSPTTAGAPRERGTACDICLLDYVAEDRVAWSRNVDCNHAYHEECILDWLLRQHTTCPTCRQEYVCIQDNEESKASSDTNDSSRRRRRRSGRINREEGEGAADD